eukprot:tig00020849_g14649.t1
MGRKSAPPDPTDSLATSLSTAATLPSGSQGQSEPPLPSATPLPAAEGIPEETTHPAISAARTQSEQRFAAVQQTKNSLYGAVAIRRQIFSSPSALLKASPENTASGCRRPLPDQARNTLVIVAPYTSFMPAMPPGFLALAEGKLTAANQDYVKANRGYGNNFLRDHPTHPAHGKLNLNGAIPTVFSGTERDSRRTYATQAVGFLVDPIGHWTPEFQNKVLDWAAQDLALPDRKGARGALLDDYRALLEPQADRELYEYVIRHAAPGGPLRAEDGSAVTTTLAEVLTDFQRYLFNVLQAGGTAPDVAGRAAINAMQALTYNSKLDGHEAFVLVDSSTHRILCAADPANQLPPAEAVMASAFFPSLLGCALCLPRGLHSDDHLRSASFSLFIPGSTAPSFQAVSYITRALYLQGITVLGTIHSSLSAGNPTLVVVCALDSYASLPLPSRRLSFSDDGLALQAFFRTFNIGTEAAPVLVETYEILLTPPASDLSLDLTYGDFNLDLTVALSKCCTKCRTGPHPTDWFHGPITCRAKRQRTSDVIMLAAPRPLPPRLYRRL